MFIVLAISAGFTDSRFCTLVGNRFSVLADLRQYGKAALRYRVKSALRIVDGAARRAGALPILCLWLGGHYAAAD